MTTPRDYHEGPPLAYQATGGAGWQSERGWGYEPLNEAAMARRLRKLAEQAQSNATALAILSNGRGRYLEWAAELARMTERLGWWAAAIETEAAAKAAEGIEV